MPIKYDPKPPDPDKTPVDRGDAPKIGEPGYFKAGVMQAPYIPDWLKTFMYKPDRTGDPDIPGYGKPMKVSQPFREFLGTPLAVGGVFAEWWKNNNKTRELSKYYTPPVTAGSPGPWSLPYDVGGKGYLETKTGAGVDRGYGRGRGTGVKPTVTPGTPYQQLPYEQRNQLQMLISGPIRPVLPTPADAAPPAAAGGGGAGGYPYYGWGYGGGGGGYGYGFSQAKKSWYSDLVNWRI